MEETLRLFLDGEVGDVWLPVPVVIGCVCGVFPLWNTVVEVEEVHLINRRLTVDDGVWRVETLLTWIEFSPNYWITMTVGLTVK